MFCSKEVSALQERVQDMYPSLTLWKSTPSDEEPPSITENDEKPASVTENAEELPGVEQDDDEPEIIIEIAAE